MYCDDPACNRARECTRRAKNRQREREARTPEVAEAPAGPAAEGGVFASTLHALGQAGRIHTPAGQQALAMASKLDAGVAESGNSFAALGRQHLAALEEALRDLTVADDPLDELRALREARAGGG